MNIFMLNPGGLLNNRTIPTADKEGGAVETQLNQHTKYFALVSPN